MQNQFYKGLILGVLFCALTVLSQSDSLASSGNESTFARIKDTTGAPPANGDFTADEKAMQNHYRKRIANAHRNIDKGEKIMRSCGEDHEKAEYKRGKVLKEAGEKNLADLKSSSPFPANSSLDPDRAPKDKKPD